MENTLEGGREGGEWGGTGSLESSIFVSRIGQQGTEVKHQGGRRGRGIQIFKTVLQQKEKEHPG